MGSKTGLGLRKEERYAVEILSTLLMPAMRLPKPLLCIEGGIGFQWRAEYFSSATDSFADLNAARG
jgi:hypothetical protein